MFEAVIFDCDGVLVDSEALAVRGERGALVELGLDYPPQDYVRRFTGLHDGAFIAELREDYLALHGREAPEDFEDRIIAGRRREMDALAVIDGALAAMEHAKERTGQIAVASSSRAHFLESKLKRMGLWEAAAPHVYSADLVKNGKPAPDIFLYTAERIAADPGRCLVIEDSANGCRAARAAGMTCWGFTGGGHCYDGHDEWLRDAGAGRVITSFAAFRQAISSAA